MKIIILGANAVGFQIAKQLIAEKKDVVIIEKDPKKAKKASEYLDCLVINALGNDPEVLKKAGINKTDFFISVTDSDEMNMIACGLVHSDFDVQNKIALIRNHDYFGSKVLSKPILGIDYIVNPEIEAAKSVIKTIEDGAVSDIVFFEENDLQMRNILVSSTSFFNNRSMKEIKRMIDVKFSFAGLIRDDQFIFPSDRIVIHENDIAYLIGKSDDLKQVFVMTQKSEVNIKKVIIAGCGKIGHYIAGFYSDNQKKRTQFFRKFLTKKSKKTKSIKIIDKDYQRCKELSDEFPNAMVIHSDISDERVFYEEQLIDYDLMICSTDNQELNVLAAVYAKNQGIKKSLALVNKHNYINIALRLKIDAIISPKNSVIHPILTLIRKGNVKSINSILNDDIEVLEIHIDDENALVGKKLFEIKLPYHSQISVISRDNELFTPDKNFQIKENDTVIFISRKSAIPKIESMVS